jgi:hypothetical protein
MTQMGWIDRILPTYRRKIMVIFPNLRHLR